MIEKTVLEKLKLQEGLIGNDSVSSKVGFPTLVSVKESDRTNEILL